MDHFLVDAGFLWALILLSGFTGSIVLINKPSYYCCAWIYNLQHCSFPSFFIAVCIVGAKKKSTHSSFERAQRRMQKSSFVKVYKQLFCSVWAVKPLYIVAASLWHSWWAALAVGPQGCECRWRTLRIPLMLYPWKCCSVGIRYAHRVINAGGIQRGRG